MVIHYLIRYVLLKIKPSSHKAESLMTYFLYSFKHPGSLSWITLVRKTIFPRIQPKYSELTCESQQRYSEWIWEIFHPGLLDMSRNCLFPFYPLYWLCTSWSKWAFSGSQGPPWGTEQHSIISLGGFNYIAQ